jgi:hypothetical protein
MSFLIESCSVTTLCLYLKGQASILLTKVVRFQVPKLTPEQFLERLICRLHLASMYNRFLYNEHASLS